MNVQTIFLKKYNDRLIAKAYMIKPPLSRVSGIDYYVFSEGITHKQFTF